MKRIGYVLLGIFLTLLIGVGLYKFDFIKLNIINEGNDNIGDEESTNINENIKEDSEKVVDNSADFIVDYIYRFGLSKDDQYFNQGEILLNDNNIDYTDVIDCDSVIDSVISFYGDDVSIKEYCVENGKPYIIYFNNGESSKKELILPSGTKIKNVVSTLITSTYSNGLYILSDNNKLYHHNDSNGTLNMKELNLFGNEEIISMGLVSNPHYSVACGEEGGFSTIIFKTKSGKILTETASDITHLTNSKLVATSNCQNIYVNKSKNVIVSDNDKVNFKFLKDSAGKDIQVNEIFYIAESEYKDYWDYKYLIIDDKNELYILNEDTWSFSLASEGKVVDTSKSYKSNGELELFTITYKNGKKVTYKSGGEVDTTYSY